MKNLVLSTKIYKRSIQKLKQNDSKNEQKKYLIRLKLISNKKIFNPNIKIWKQKNLIS